MPDPTPDPELKAIQQVIEALDSVQPDARERVIAYVFQRLGLGNASALTLPALESPILPPSNLPPIVSHEGGVHDIRTLAKSKKPKSDNEMAAVVAYYLKNVAPTDERKDAISREEIEKYFVQADFPLPKQPQFTLTNAKNAGYFDRTGTGLYKLNPVGHNLVAHSLGDANTTRREKGKRQKGRKAKPRKKSTTHRKN
jgi:hypothetical protein